MNTRPLSAALLCAGAVVVAAPVARAEAEVVKEPNLLETLSSTPKPVIEVRGETPYVEIDGKLVAAPLDLVRYYPTKGPLVVDAKVAPAWVFASHLRTEIANLIQASQQYRIKDFDQELRFSVELKSPTALDRVFVGVAVFSEQRNQGIYFQEVGTLRPYKTKTVSIRKRLRLDSEDAYLRWHVFAQGRETLHSLMDQDYLGPALNSLVSRARKGVRDAAAEPYLTFPPENPPRAAGSITLELELSPEGAIDHASAVGANNPAVEKSLLETVSNWRFLPQVVDGRCIESKVTVAVDLSHWKTWSNDCVRVMPAAATAPPPTSR